MSSQSNYRKHPSHHRNADIDRGPVIASSQTPAQFDQSYLWNVLNLYREGSRNVIEAITQLKSGLPLISKPQQGRGRYYTFPTATEIKTAPVSLFAQSDAGHLDRRQVVVERALVPEVVFRAADAAVARLDREAEPLVPANGRAGVVGHRKFAYDIWGDAVNLASRMESSGEAGRINISASTYERIKEKFTCTFRGEIEAKNKGAIDMYFVNRKNQQA